MGETKWAGPARVVDVSLKIISVGLCGISFYWNLMDLIEENPDFAEDAKVRRLFGVVTSCSAVVFGYYHPEITEPASMFLTSGLKALNELKSIPVKGVDNIMRMIEIFESLIQVLEELKVGAVSAKSGAIQAWGSRFEATLASQDAETSKNKMTLRCAIHEGQEATMKFLTELGPAMREQIQKSFEDEATLMISIMTSSSQWAGESRRLAEIAKVALWKLK